MICAMSLKDSSDGGDVAGGAGRELAVGGDRREERALVLDRLDLPEHVVHERGHRQRPVAHARARDQVVHRQRRRDQPGARSPRGAAAEGRDSDHSADPVALEGLARRPAEVHIDGLGALGAIVRGHQPEDSIGTCERVVDDLAVAVRSLYDLETPARLRGQARRVAHDDANRLIAAEEVLEDLVADLAGRSRDDDHDARRCRGTRAFGRTGSLAAINLQA
jgi:hypothetical protein